MICKRATVLTLANKIGLLPTLDLTDFKLRIKGLVLDETMNLDEK